MDNSDKIKKYAVKLASELGPRLQGNVQADMIVYPTNVEGAVIEVQLVRRNKRPHKAFQMKPASSNVNSVLKKIQQHFIGGDIDSVKFSGTNISLENNRILLIKGDNSELTEANAIADLTRVFHAHGGE